MDEKVRAKETQEYIVEEFGRDYASNIFSGNELMNILEDYMEEFQ